MRPKMRPFFTYFGAKWAAATRYPEPGDTVVEPFAGAAGYSVRWGVRRAILLDRDPNIVGTWQYLIGVSGDEVRNLPLIRVGETVDDLDVIPEARMLIGWWCNKASTRPSKSLSAWARDPRHANQFWGERIRERLAVQVDLIREWTVTEGDYSDAPMLNDATYFVDPPYFEAGKFYRHKFTAFDDLGAWCRTLPGQVIVCEGSASATWLPFRPYYSGKATTKTIGASAYSAEYVWLSGSVGGACVECGNDDPCEGYNVCSDCLEESEAA